MCEAIRYQTDWSPEYLSRWTVNTMILVTYSRGHLDNEKQIIGKLILRPPLNNLLYNFTGNPWDNEWKSDTGCCAKVHE